MINPILLLVAVTIRAPATLRSACDPASEAVSALPAGEAVEIKFAFAGTGCYKISTTVDGRTLAGYVDGKDLAGVDQFDRNRQAASELDISGIQNRVVESVAPTSRLAGAVTALKNNQPAEALALVEPAARSSRDPQLLTLAGFAAWRADDPGGALDYWKRSLELQPNADLERLYEKVRRENAADQSSGRIVGMRILLRYEPQTVSLETARAMTQALDTEFSRISSELGCTSNERLVAIVQSRGAYLATSGAAEWSGGLYDGRIRVALVDDAGLEPGTRRVFAHELVHACLANLGRFPPWLHEGLAQKLSGDRLSPSARDEVERLIAAHALPRLELLGQNLPNDSAGRARAVYALALYAADLLSSRYAATGLPNLLRNPSMLAQATTELDRQLGLI